MLYWTPFWVPFVFAAAWGLAMLDNRATLLSGRGGGLFDPSRDRQALTIVSLPLQAAVLVHGFGALRWWLAVLIVLAGAGLAVVLVSSPRAQASLRVARPALVALLALLTLVLWWGYVPNY